ncbi:MAG TPA: tetratricopeptide repeat protein, partial [Gemmataceae bacterium]|nr:tetratricopeptide repeat protein [Gemmataceae bacterium]
DNSDLAAQPKGEPFNGYDCYAMGMLHFWIAVRTEAFMKLGVKLDTLSTYLKTALGDYGGLDLVKPRETADAMLRQATKLEPDHYWSHFWLGWSYLETDPPQWHAAEMAFSKCIEIRPQFSFGYGERGLLRIRLWSEIRDDLWRRALQHHGSEDLRQALHLSPDDPTIHWIHARANEFLGKGPEMVAHCAQAVELEAPLKSLDGRSLERNSTLAEGVKKFLEDRLANRLGMDAEAIIAQAWWVLANEQNALDVALKVLKANPKQPRALAVRGAVMLRRGQLKEALSDFDAALDKLPMLFLASAGRGRALELLDRHQDALDNYDKILTGIAKTDWQRLEGYLGRARALAALGRVDDAQAALEHAEEIMPGITEAVGKK